MSDRMNNSKQQFSVHHGHRRGFSITFENGYRVSVQFSPSNYCDNYNLGVDLPDVTKHPDKWNNCMNAEVGVISPTGEMVSMYRNQSDGVLYNVEPELLAKIINRVSEFKGVNNCAYSS